MTKVKIEIAGRIFEARRTAPGEIVVYMDGVVTKYKLNFSEEKGKFHPAGPPNLRILTKFLEQVASHMLEGANS